jgi:hypothetical protein
VKIHFTAKCNTADEEIRRNEAINSRLALPAIGPVSERLAVIGGGASIADRLDEIRRFDGERWAINGAFRWCSERGMESTFFSVDARPVVVPMAQGAKRAVLALRCDPALFAIPHVEIADASDLIGPSSATTAPLVAIKRGHRHMTFFGCESCYSVRAGPSPSPVDYQDRLLVRVGDAEFLTNPGLLMQAEMLAEIIRSAPHVFSEQSGGLLRALIACPDYDVIAATENVHRTIKCKTSPQTLEAS